MDNIIDKRLLNLSEFATHRVIGRYEGISHQERWSGLLLPPKVYEPTEYDIHRARELSERHDWDV